MTDTLNAPAAARGYLALADEADEAGERLTQRTNNPLDGLLIACADAIRALVGEPAADTLNAPALPATDWRELVRQLVCCLRDCDVQLTRQTGPGYKAHMTHGSTVRSLLEEAGTNLRQHDFAFSDEPELWMKLVVIGTMENGNSNITEWQECEPLVEGAIPFFRLPQAARSTTPSPAAPAEAAKIQAVVDAAREWSGERMPEDWTAADLMKAIASLDGDWPGCEGCDFECGESCTPATVAEMHAQIDHHIADLVHAKKLYAATDYAPPAGWKPKHWIRPAAPVSPNTAGGVQL